MENRCVDCGQPCTGIRCKKDHGAYLARLALAATAERDAEILQMVDGEHLSGQRLADRMGISRTRAQRIARAARTRTLKRAALVANA